MQQIPNQTCTNGRISGKQNVGLSNSLKAILKLSEVNFID